MAVMIRCVVFCVGVVTFSWLSQLASAAEISQSGLRVMSFNIRYSAAKDGPDAWEKRKGFLLETVKAFAPDLLGMQEVLEDQAEFMQAGLTDCGFVGTGRDDGKKKGEYSPILYNKDRFELLASGQFW